MNDFGNSLYLRFHIFLSFDGSLVDSLHTRKKGRVLPFLRKERNQQWDRCLFRVTYNESQSILNEGEYTTVDKVHEALRAFIEPELIEYVQETVEERNDHL